MAKNAFDRFMERYPLHFLESVFQVSFYSSPSRFGFASIFSTISLSLIAIAIAWYAVYKAENGGHIMLGFIIAIGVIGAVGMMAIGIMSVYFLRNQNDSNIDLFMRGVEKGITDTTPDVKPPERKIEEFGIRVGKRANKVLNELDKREKNAKTTKSKKNRKV